jgi:branched-chain amino acid aminotransferase
LERANLDWSNLGFGLTPTDVNIRYRWRDGNWSKAEVTSSLDIPMNIAATALHYGQAMFEGLKAFETADKRTVIFRPEENADRMARGARKLLMQAPPEELFLEAVTEAVRLNSRYLPPSDSGASLYIRPLLIGTGARVGVKPADEYLFLVFVTPVGPYFKHGLKPISLRVEEEVNRAAPLGVGDVKAAGNYAAGMRATQRAKDQGYDNVLYLDSREGRWIDETGATNFFGIRDSDQGATYVTPRSMSILPSITNNSLMTIAKDLGMTVEHRPVPIEELETFSEVGCCGTAAIIAPVGQIEWRGKTLSFGSSEEPGPWTRKLYDNLTGIQYGRVNDKHGWLREI